MYDFIVKNVALIKQKKMKKYFILINIDLNC